MLVLPEPQLDDVPLFVLVDVLFEDVLVADVPVADVPEVDTLAPLSLDLLVVLVCAEPNNAKAETKAKVKMIFFIMDIFQRQN